MRRGAARRRPALAAAALATAALALGGCLNHYLIHSRRPGAIETASQRVVRGRLEMRLEWAHPAGDGPLPAVLVHPEARHEAREMRGVLHSLAEAGYLALAVDYKRRRRPGEKKPLFVWQDPDDPERALRVLLEHPRVDPERVAAMGYSQGGVYSLLIAAYSGRLRAVVAYYPIADFARWLDAEDLRPARRLVFRVIRWHFKRRLGVRSDEALERELLRASPYRVAEQIDVPVLIIHGEKDTSVPLAQARLLHERLLEVGGQSELMVMEGAGHVFNFRKRELAERAWVRAKGFLDRELGAGR